MNKHNLTVGQTVFVEYIGGSYNPANVNGIEDAVILSVGKKYFRLTGDRWYKQRFYLETLKHDGGEYSSKYQVHISKQAVLDEKEAGKLYEKRGNKSISLQQLMAIASILNIDNNQSTNNEQH